jgi:hypothetical protein
MQRPKQLRTGMVIKNLDDLLYKYETTPGYSLAQACRDYPTIGRTPMYLYRQHQKQFKGTKPKGPGRPTKIQEWLTALLLEWITLYYNLKFPTISSIMHQVPTQTPRTTHSQI